MKISRRKKQRKKKDGQKGKGTIEQAEFVLNWKKPFHFPDYPTNSLCFII